jgi:chromosome segregation ATPase
MDFLPPTPSAVTDAFALLRVITDAEHYKGCVQALDERIRLAKETEERAARLVNEVNADKAKLAQDREAFEHDCNTVKRRFADREKELDDQAALNATTNNQLQQRHAKLDEDNERLKALIEQHDKKLAELNKSAEGVASREEKVFAREEKVAQTIKELGPVAVRFGLTQ